MALNLEVKYAAALTQEERKMLIKIEDIVKEAASGSAWWVEF